MAFVLSYLPCSVLKYALITSETKPYPSMGKMYSSSVISFLMFGVLPFEGPCQIDLTPQYDDYEARKRVCWGDSTS